MRQLGSVGVRGGALPAASALKPDCCCAALKGVAAGAGGAEGVLVATRRAPVAAHPAHPAPPVRPVCQQRQGAGRGVGGVHHPGPQVRALRLPVRHHPQRARVCRLGGQDARQPLPRGVHGCGARAPACRALLPPGDGRAGGRPRRTAVCPSVPARARRCTRGAPARTPSRALVRYCPTHARPPPDYRPTPLEHYVFPAGGDGIFLVVDNKGTFRCAAAGGGRWYKQLCECGCRRRRLLGGGRQQGDPRVGVVCACGALPADAGQDLGLCALCA